MTLQRSRKTSRGLMRSWWPWRRSLVEIKTRFHLVKFNLRAWTPLAQIHSNSCTSIDNLMITLSMLAQSTSKLKSMFFPTIFQESLQSVECLWTTMRSKGNSWSSKTMSFGSSLRSSKRSMIIFKMSSTRRQETKWMSGQDLLIGTGTSSRSSSLFAPSAGST